MRYQRWNPPDQIQSILREVQKSLSVPLGIHAHNDAEMAVANTILAVQGGIRMVQGPSMGMESDAVMPISVPFSPTLN